MNKEIKLLSLFSGCGGMDLGFKGGFWYLGNYYPPTGISLALALDIDRWACETFRFNFGPDKIIVGDISKIPSSGLPDPDIIIGGFPCQDFSITRAHKRAGITVKRGMLYQEFVRLVKDKRPSVFVAENVKGILSANKGLAIKVIISDFEELGYVVKKDIWNFADYGVPQIRERVIIVGIREDIDFVYKKPLPTHLNNRVPSGLALSGIPADAPNNELIRINERTRKVIASIPEGGNNKETTDKRYFVKGVMSNIYRRLDRYKPSPTIIAAGGGGTWGYHFEEPRPLTNRERARLQSFPDDFVFFGSIAEVRRQIGNAVPPVGAYAVARAVLPAFSAPSRSIQEIEKLRYERKFKSLSFLEESQLTLPL